MEYMAAQMDRQIEGAQLAYDEALRDGQQPAFPLKEPLASDALGVTVRDYFAAKAMQALIANAGFDANLRSQVAAEAYGFADDMLASRAFLHTA